MTAEAAYSRSWPVGHRTVTLTMRPSRPGQVHSIAMEWAPDRPRGLRDDELHQYRVGRDQALRELSAELGLAPPVVLEVG